MATARSATLVEVVIVEVYARGAVFKEVVIAEVTVRSVASCFVAVLEELS